MNVEKYYKLTRYSGDRVVWTGKVVENKRDLQIPLKWRKPRLIFVNSMSDLFHEDVTNSFIQEVWDIMSLTPQHTYQILTKRPERMAVMDLPVLHNVWLGTSVEDHNVINRIDLLKATAAQVRFISFEPLIGAVGDVDLTDIHWAIVGGESGYSARPMSTEWVDEIHKACVSQNVPFFFKQWGAWSKNGKLRTKKQNGRTYKGRVWNEMPNDNYEKRFLGLTSL